ncbi:helix-turn-helix transcriptional regulator [uncultured Pseudacidovorax sp.]|uniref:helix-turn-helix domain-containing protein n=1 Tax=uncultured Pseudacidovorax sp. TaxID=679313 RepID=UPI0025E99F4C|nr:helix-turn-helix transcriptional regulator [uncultured Pseudacidovorax sp.]
MKDVKVRQDMAARIAQARKTTKLTQGELAEVLGVSQQLVAKWERATAAPSTWMLPNLCIQLGVRADFLLFGAEQHAECPPAGRPQCDFIKIYRRGLAAPDRPPMK